MDREEFGKEFVLRDPGDYEECGKGFARDGIRRNLIYYKPKDKFGYIVKQGYKDDDSYYAPRLLYKAGQKIGIDLPQTELGFFHVLDEWDESYSQAFYSGSCVFLTDSSRYESFSGFQRVSQEEVLEMYKRNRNLDEDYDRHARPTFDDYINANMHFLITRGSKPANEMPKAEKNAILQELIDRAMFGLRFETEGENEIFVYRGSNAKLSSYYPAADSTLGLRLSLYDGKNSKKTGSYEEGIMAEGFMVDDGLVNLSDDGFGMMRETEIPAQYDISYGQKKRTTPTELLEYMFKKYPDETEKAYQKMKGYTTQDLQDELDSYTTMNRLHKKFAIRAFECRGQILDKAYQEHMKAKTLETR